MRIELLHPLVVHFPIALLLVGVLLRCIALFLKRSELYPYVMVSSWIILGIGVCCAWLAVLAGEFAADVVGKNLCQPNILQDHKKLAYTAAILFTCALLLDWGKMWGKNYFSPLFNKVIGVTRFVLFLVATVILLSAAYFGGSLVYEQGAAVEKRCTQAN